MVDFNKLLLNMTLPENDAAAPTVRDYLKRLLHDVWYYDEGFDGKRPFGNSGWKYDLYVPMIQNGFVDGSVDSDGYVESVDSESADKLIYAAIGSL